MTTSRLGAIGTQRECRPVAFFQLMRARARRRCRRAGPVARTGPRGGRNGALRIPTRARDRARTRYGAAVRGDDDLRLRTDLPTRARRHPRSAAGSDRRTQAGPALASGGRHRRRAQRIDQRTAHRPTCWRATWHAPDGWWFRVSRAASTRRHTKRRSTAARLRWSAVGHRRHLPARERAVYRPTFSRAVALRPRCRWASNRMRAISRVGTESSPVWCGDSWWSKRRCTRAR